MFHCKNPIPQRMILPAVLAAAILGVTGMAETRQPVAAVQASSLEPIVFQTPGATIPSSARDVAIGWADTLAHRQAAFRFALLSDGLKQKEYPEYKKAGWMIGGSSPWVTGYTIREEDKTDAGTKYKIDYTFTDSTRANYMGAEEITVKQAGPVWQVVQHENLPDGYPNLTEDRSRKNTPVWEKPPVQLPNRTAQGTADLWAEAMKQRNGAFRFAVLPYDSQMAEGDGYRKENWSIGYSSPGVVGYEAVPVDETDHIGEYAKYQITYHWEDSAGKSYRSTETISLKNYGEIWLVTKHGSGVPAPETAGR